MGGLITGLLLGINPVLGAAVGMMAVVASASNTPISAIVMGMELFGSYISVLRITAQVEPIQAQERSLKSPVYSEQPEDAGVVADLASWHARTVKRGMKICAKGPIERA
ncbi:chloride channel protein [Alicyclobacillus ferrooxydans]|uniref:chloride channel protein n=1 Tax=Alicyclobacillus ferrooxydans TaxID=471514 RepID=UPI00247FD0D1|nr:chloride channel protein [Alicyclobacillus ferrooxydans]